MPLLRLQPRVMVCAAIFVTGITASANAAAGLLEKLLAPAVGTKPGFSEGKKTYDEDTLKPEDLTKCVVTAHDYDERVAHKPTEVEELGKMREELNKTAAGLKTDIEASQKNPVTEEQAEKLNARIAAYKAKEAEFNKRSDAANLNAKAYNKAVAEGLDTFRDLCAGRRFYKSDLEVIRPQLPFDISDILAGKK